uniref:Uncharacterized protein n=1 Tax=Oryza sativa subsp. japonica TaxID=39947 RepID=Q8S5E1_ORYSJ|nr:Hypothetical protein [Oryza sativa Japonica Group]
MVLMADVDREWLQHGTCAGTGHMDVAKRGRGTLHPPSGGLQHQRLASSAAAGTSKPALPLLPLIRASPSRRRRQSPPQSVVNSSKPGMLGASAKEAVARGDEAVRTVEEAVRFLDWTQGRRPRPPVLLDLAGELPLRLDSERRWEKEGEDRKDRG